MTAPSHDQRIAEAVTRHFQAHPWDGTFPQDSKIDWSIPGAADSTVINVMSSPCTTASWFSDATSSARAAVMSCLITAFRTAAKSAAWFGVMRRSLSDRSSS